MWKQETTDQLLELLSIRLPFAKIAEVLGKTRNACIGKAHRELPDAPPRPRERKIASVKRVNVASINRARSSTVEPSPHERGVVGSSPAEPTSGSGLAIMDLKPHHCRWLLDDGSYCGKQKVANIHRSYCEEHVKRAYYVTGELTI